MTQNKTSYRQVPKMPPAALGLGLCDIRKVLTQANLAALENDLANLAKARRQFPPNDVFVN